MTIIRRRTSMSSTRVSKPSSKFGPARCGSELARESEAGTRGSELARDITALADRNVFIVTVPAPVDADRRPDFTPLIKASQTVGRLLKTGDLAFHESTVYPGATEEICVPELERVSGLKFDTDFSVGYSPGRINPGDKPVSQLRKLKHASDMAFLAISSHFLSSLVICPAKEVPHAKHEYFSA